MSLREHLIELRSRMLKSALAIAAGAVVGWILYEQIFDILSFPIESVVAQAQARGADVKLIMTGVAQAFTLRLQVSAVAGVVIASPVWIYQLWRFLTPGLRRRERRWGILFVGVSVPLFLAGILVAYRILPSALEILFEFTPSQVSNYVPVDTYLSFFLRMSLVFGIGFLIPVVLVGLNLAGVLTGRKLASGWRFIVFGVFVFAAVATPTGDPVNLLMLAGPMFLLTALALVFCFVNDRRRAARATEPDYATWSDDEVSPL